MGSGGALAESTVCQEAIQKSKNGNEVESDILTDSSLTFSLEGQVKQSF